MSLLDYYWTLASEVPEERIKAAQLLIKGLQDKDAVEDWDYALNRLIRGLASSKGGARLGFSMALAEILDIRASSISIDLYFDKVSENLEVSGGMKGSEERGVLFGKLFALKTLAASTLWTDASDRHWKLIIDAFLDLSLCKPWLREPVFFSLCELLQGAPKDAIKYALDGVTDRDLAKTCEGVAIALSVPADERKNLNEKSGWVNGDPLYRKNLLELARVLKTVPVGGTKTNSWKPDLHFVWNLLVSQFVTTIPAKQEERPAKKQKREKTKEKKDLDLGVFWRTVVDEGLFAANSSSERKLWGYAVFNDWLQKVVDVQPLFSTNLLRSLSNQLAQNDRNLHKMAKLVVQTVLAIAKTRQNATEILSAILSVNPFFDNTSKTHLVQDLLALDLDPARAAKLLLDIFVDADSFNKRQWALNSIIHLLKSQKADDISWIAPVLTTLVPYAYFDAAGDDTKLVELVQQRLLSILSIGMNNIDSRQTWPFFVFKTIKEYDGQPRVEFDEEVMHRLQRAELTLEKINKKRMSSRHVDSPQLQAFELLFSMALLQIYASSTEAVAIVDELLLCYNNIAGQSRQQDMTDENDGIDASQVLTEVLISFLSQRSALLRKLSEDVWGSFAEKISAESLQLLFDIIVAKESLEGQQELFEDVAMGDSDEGDDGEDDEEDENESDEDDDDEREESKHEDSDSDSDSEPDLDEAAKGRLATALGVGESDDEESMDDEQMTALDGQLATIFRERQNMLSSNRQQALDQQNAKENITALKGRVLDLLDIFVVKQPKNILCLRMIAPLLMVMQITKDVSLGNKARELLRKLCKSTTIALEDNEQLEDGFAVLETVQGIAADATNKPLSLACNQAAVFTSKLIMTRDKALIGRLLGIYTTALEKWVLDAKSKTTPNMFVDLVNFLAQKR